MCCRLFSSHGFIKLFDGEVICNKEMLSVLFHKYFSDGHNLLQSPRESSWYEHSERVVVLDVIGMNPLDPKPILLLSDIPQLLIYPQLLYSKQLHPPQDFFIHRVS